MSLPSHLFRLSVPVLLLILGSALASSGGATALAPSVQLSPDSGPAPEVSGSLGGSGWTCSSGSPGPATVSGAGATGSASITRSGGLTGNFIVMGDAGDRVTVMVSSSCPGIVPIVLQASAVFIFESPTATATNTPTETPTATATPTPTATMTATPTPTATATNTSTPPGVLPANTPTQEPTATPIPTPTGTPGPATATGETSTLTFTGCTPDEPEVMLSFVPIQLVGTDGGNGGGTGILVPAKKDPADPQAFLFQGPVGEPGTQFLVTPKYEDSDCGDGVTTEPVGWTPGHDIDVSNVYNGTYTLEICDMVDKKPCEYDVIKGGASPSVPKSATSEASAADPEAWVTEMVYFPGQLAKRKMQYFRFTTDFPDPESLKAVLQASVWPFPTGNEKDLYGPPGLVAQWDVDCANCEFPIDLSGLEPGLTLDGGPQTAIAKNTWYKPAVDVVTFPGDVAEKGYKLVLGLFGGGGEKKANETTGGKPGEVTTLPLVDGNNNGLLPQKGFYFRIVMYKSAMEDSWPSDNTVRLQEVPKPPDIKLIPPTPTTPVATGYMTEIISYHGIIPRIRQDKYPCFVVVETAWPKPFGFAYTTDESMKLPGSKPLTPGQTICAPDPKKPNLFEQVLEWIEAGIDWASEAWQDIKQYAVDAVLNLTPLGLQCDLLENSGTIPKGACEGAFSVALDAALASMGIPPDLPNFDELMDQGIEYVAVQAAAQMSIPPEVVKAATEQGGPYAGVALDIAEEQMRAGLEAGIKSKLASSLKEIQLSYGKSVGWLPYGIPVRPDSDQPPAATLRITRIPGAPGGEAGCSITVMSGAKLPNSVLEKAPPGYEFFMQNLATKLSSLTFYDVFINEGNLLAQGWSGGPDKKMTIPALEPGESVEIPMTFKPNIEKNGWYPLNLVSISDYFQVWNFIHEFSTLTMTAQGTCGMDQIVVPMKGVYKK